MFFGCVFNQFCTAPVLERIVTPGETFCVYYEPESKAQSMAWEHPTSTVAKKFKIQPSAGKIMFTLFGDMKGAILVNSTPKRETVNSQISICLAQ
jgi:hypothetical protein